MRTAPLLVACIAVAYPAIIAQADEATVLAERADAVSARALQMIDEVAAGLDTCPADPEEYPALAEVADTLYDDLIRMPEPSAKTGGKVRLALSIVEMLRSELLLRECAAEGA